LIHFFKTKNVTYSVISIRNVKLAVIERAMNNIGRDEAPATKDDASKLDKFLNADD
jgi:hypothetical protein